jgi:uncharacterized phage protein gp47/JayE
VSLDCTLPRPSIEELQQSVKTEISTRMLGGAPVLPFSNEDVLAFIMAGTVNLMHGYVAQGLKESDPKDMCCDNLVAYAARRGIFLQGAERSRGIVIITGVAGAAIPANIRFVDDASQEYKLDPSYTTNPTVLDADGSAALFIAASGGGSRYNQAPGTVLTVSTTIPDINISATVTTAGLIGGADDETCDQLRVRVLDSEKQGALSTNVDWFLSKSKSWPGVTRICTDECEQCCEETIVMYPFFDGAYENGIPPSSVIDSMNTWMFGPARTHGEGLAPIGISGSYKVALPTGLKVTVRCVAGCSPNTEETVAAAVRAVILDETCVGSTICLEHLKRAVTNSLGTACAAEPVLEFDETILTQDEQFAYLDCGRYLRLTEVEIL